MIMSELSLQSRMKLYEAIANRMQKKVKSSKFVVSFKDLETPFSLTEDKQILRIYSIKNDNKIEITKDYIWNLFERAIDMIAGETILDSLIDLMRSNNLNEKED